MNIRLGLHENIAKNQIFIDGITRCGKSMFSHVIPSLKNVEHIKFLEFIEHIVPALSLGLIDKDFAKNYVRMNMNMIAYDNRLGRNSNFRPDDQTGVVNAINPSLYRSRLQRPEGDDVITDMRSDNRAMVYQTHDLLVNLEHLNELGIDYKMIALFRNPIDNIYSWWTRGWGKRFGNDPRAFTLTLDHNNVKMPWYCRGFEDAWVMLNEAERCVKTAGSLIQRSVMQYKQANQKENIHIISFEKFCTQPDYEIPSICKFLETEVTKFTFDKIREARCPRILKDEDIKAKIDKFKSNLSSELFDYLMDLSAQYEKNLYGIQSC